MLYERIQPAPVLSSFIDCFWVIENDDPSINREKIIPDGFPEIIFHYGDPYRISISGKWEEQSRALVAGQIRNHFFLENSGVSGMIGVKLQPAAPTELFDLDMSELTEKVLDLEAVLSDEFRQVIPDMISDTILWKQKIDRIENHIIEHILPGVQQQALVHKAVTLIFESNGTIPISELCEKIRIGERRLERIFSKYIGLSPKFYARIIRFNHVFKLVQKRKYSWSELSQIAGFYDQSHFINNFREFTGEEPSTYIFEDENMANFFLNRPE